MNLQSAIWNTRTTLGIGTRELWIVKIAINVLQFIYIILQIGCVENVHTLRKSGNS